MRIFVATGIFHPDSGGPATYLYHILPELVARGHEVTVLTFGDDTDKGYPYPVTRISRRRNYVVRQVLYFLAARHLWPGHDVAFVHSMGLPLPQAIKPRVVKIVGDKAWERAVNKAWIPSDRDIDSFQCDTQPLLAEMGKLARARESQKSDAIIVPSHYLKHMVVGWGVDSAKIRVIYNALYMEPAPVQTKKQARQTLDVSEDRPTLATVARLTPWKGIDHTLQALAQLPDVCLIVAGDGPTRESLEALARSLRIEERVRFLGYVPREQVPLLFQAADAAVLYSGYEGLPHVLLEALHTSTPVIASDKGGNREVVEHEINGLLVPYVDVEALTSAIRHILQPENLTRFESQAAILNPERFSWDSMVRQTTGVLESVL